MRTILLTLMFLLTFTAPAFAQEEPITEENQATDEITEEAEYAGPVGNIRLKDGSAIEITELEKLGKYYIYISGKLNGRASTVISLTRLKDLKRWASFTFKDPYNFIITTKSGKDLRFLDSRIYIGSDSHETFSFYTTTNDYQKKLIEINKADVTSINID